MLLNVGQICAALGLSRATFYRVRRNDPSFPCAKVVNGSPRWTRADVEGWVARRALTATPGVL